MSVDDSLSECETDNDYESNDGNCSEQSADEPVCSKNESSYETRVNYIGKDGYIWRIKAVNVRRTPQRNIVVGNLWLKGQKVQSFTPTRLKKLLMFLLIKKCSPSKRNGQIRR